MVTLNGKYFKVIVKIFFKRKEFPNSSVGKESACNAGDLDSIPGLGRYAGEGID